MSLSAPKNNLKTFSTSRIKTKPKKNEKLFALDECKRLYQKYYSYPSSSLLKMINENCLKLFLEKFNYKDISVLSILLSKYYFFQQLEISPNDPNKSEINTTKKKYGHPVLSEEEKSKIKKEKYLRERDMKKMINKIIITSSNHLYNSNSIISFSLNNIDLNEKYCEMISKGILNNKSLQSISFTNCQITLNNYELLLQSLLTHNLLSYLDLSDNNFGDKYGRMISRIIVRHAQRRDQIVWSYGLRNEVPLSNDYKKGLIYINLNGNNLSKDSADSITNALYTDQYIRAIYLNNNKFDDTSCKKFIYMMRKNLTILTIDLRGNPGYDTSIHSRLVLKMSKNIRYLYHQYKKNEYSEEEFERFKIFIDVSFFDVDIPQNVVEFYNNNLPQTTEENKNIKENTENNNNTYLENKKITSDIKEEKGDNNVNNNNIDNINNINASEENKKLYNENLRLRKEIIELKAKNLQKKLGGKSSQKEQIININNDESKESKSDVENDYQRAELLIKELNDLMNKIEKKESKKKEKNKKKDIKEIKNKIIIKTNEEQEERFILPETSHKTEVNKENENKQNISNTNSNNKEKDVNISNKDKDIESNKSNGIDINTINKEEEKNDKNEIKNDLEMQYQNAELPEDIDKDKESSDSHFVDENGNVHNFDDLSDEEKMIILQQQLILQRLQEEAEARGEQFDPQEYIEYLEKQAKEEEENELNEQQSQNKLNKSF